MPQRPLYGRVYTGVDYDGPAYPPDEPEDPRIARYEAERDDPDPDPSVDWEP